jgi:hypothetical protein
MDTQSATAPAEKQGQRRHPQVISASRRTDIPAFHLDWLYDRLSRGSVTVRNPFRLDQSWEVDLAPERVHTIVLWSKDFSKLLENDRPLRPYRLFFHFTINDSPAVFEPLLPPLKTRLDQLGELARRFGPDRIVWRFDPIVFWRESGQLKDNTNGFEDLAAQVAGLGIKRCSTAIVDLYRKALRRAHTRNITLVEPTGSVQQDLGFRLKETCVALGLELRSCCSTGLLGVPGIVKGRCIDGPLLNQLAETLPIQNPSRAASERPVPTRKGCGCTQSVDIGDYRRQPCGHRCLYCYANPNAG